MGFRRFLRRRDWDEERARELQAYIEQETADNVARGMTPDQARAAAHRRLGNVTRIREEIYDFNTLRRLEACRLDLRDAWRQMRRRWPAALTAGLLLALGIGASTAGFAIVYGTLLRPLAYPDGERLVALWQVRDGQLKQLTAPDFRDIAAAPMFERAALFWSGRVTVTAGLDVERVVNVEAQHDLLTLLGARVVLGRLTGVSDANQPVTLITSRLWRRVFHEDPAIVGRAIQVSGRPYTVVGVLADGLSFELPVGDAAAEFTIKDVDLWMPFGAGGAFPDSRNVWTFEAVARLRDGARLAEAQAALDTIGANLARQYPDTNRGRTFRAVPLRTQMVGARAAAIWLGFAGAILVLVVACVNAASLALGELPSRRRDFALREALGAGRARLLRQVAIESGLLAGAAAVAGLVVGAALCRAFVASLDLPRADAIRIDGAVAIFAGLTAFASAFASRLLPMLRLEGGAGGLRASTSLHAASAPRLRRALVAAQLALALVSCAIAALFGASLRAVLRVDPGFAIDRALSARVSAYEQSYASRADVTRFFGDLLARLSAEPGVIAAAAASSLPLTGSVGGASVMAEGREVPVADRITAGWQTATPGLFRAMGIPIKAGRDFTAADLTRRAAHHTVISESLARRLFGDGDPIGRRIVVGPPGDVVDWHEVVGVVGDVRQSNLTDEPGPRVYDLFGEHWSRTMFVVVRGEGDAETLAPLVRGHVRAVNPEAPVFQVQTIDALFAASVAPRRSVTAIAAGVGVASLLLAALGVYALLASSVAARTREIGVRRALGASSTSIMSLVTREALAMSIAGVAIGIAATAMLGRVIQAQLFGVTAMNPLVLAASVAGLLAVSLGAALLPARRAARVDPAIALRAE